MEDHVGRLLSPSGLLRALPAVAAAGSALAAILRALSPAPGSTEWAVLAALLGALALPLARLAAGQSGPGRALAIGAAIAGALVAGVFLGETAAVVLRAYRDGGPSLSL